MSLAVGLLVAGTIVGVFFNLAIGVILIAVGAALLFAG